MINILPNEFWNGCKPSFFRTPRNIQWVELGKEFSLYAGHLWCGRAPSLCLSVESHWETNSGSSRTNLPAAVLPLDSLTGTDWGLSSQSLKEFYKPIFFCVSWHTTSSSIQQLFAPEYLAPYPHLCRISHFWRRDFRPHGPLHFFHKITLRDVSPVSCRKKTCPDKKTVVTKNHC